MARARFKSDLILTILLALLVAACGAAPEATPTPPEAVLPSATPSSPPPLAILLAPEGADSTLATESGAIVSAYAAEAGLAYETRTALSTAEVPAQLSLVVALAPTPNLGELAAAAPQARFIALGFDPGQAAANLETLPLSSGGGAEAAFVAGYTAAIATDDWRIGVLYSAAEADLAAAFVAGGRYFCGSCAPVAPPFSDYPAALQGEPAAWQAAADNLLGLGVRTVYLTPAMEIPELQAHLAVRGANLIGSGAPAEGAAANWMVSIAVDPLAALRQQLPALLRGEAPGEAPSALALSNINSGLLSGARVEDIQALIRVMESGYIALP